MHTRTQHSSSNRVCKRKLSLYIISTVYYVLADAEGGGARTPPLFAEGLLVSALLGGFDCFAAYPYKALLVITMLFFLSKVFLNWKHQNQKASSTAAE